MRIPPVACLGLVATSVALVGVACFVGGTAPFAAAGGGPVAVKLVDAFPGAPSFVRPLFALQPPDGTDRIFVVEQRGLVHVLEHPYTASSPPRGVFLNISAEMGPRGNEEGLLGLAFHPDYAQNGRFFVHYSASAPRRNVLAEGRVSALDPDAAAAEPLATVLQVPQPFDNHNGGMIAFGPDGYLYVALGDGGSAGDPLDYAQDLRQPHGSILRIDVDDPPQGSAYSIPADNPFVDRPGARGEIWAYGLRNPWRFSFDRATGDLWLGDVGQNTSEEIDLIVKGGNYGWDRKEGFLEFEPEPTPPADPLIDPLATYPRSQGRSVTGGYVYRGSAIPALVGSYLYADYVTGRVWRLCPKEGVVGPPASAADVTVEVLFDTGQSLASFAEDRAGELYLCTFEGRVLRLELDGSLPPPPGEELPGRLSELNLFADLARLRPVDGALPYRVHAALWSDGAKKDRFLVVPGGSQMRYADEALELPVGAYAVKTFTLPGRGAARRLETRVIRRTNEGFDVGTYRWNEGRTEAFLLDEHLDEDVPARRGRQTWPFPSASECRSCHLPEAGFLLGVNARQLRSAEKRGPAPLADWAARGVLAGALPAEGSYERNVAIRRGGKLDARVRSYLDANCAFCHRPGAPDAAGLDLRRGTDVEATGMIDAVPQDDLGIADARVVAPGDPGRSVLLERIRTRGSVEQMPTVGSHLVDKRAARVVKRWIRRMRRTR